MNDAFTRLRQSLTKRIEKLEKDQLGFVYGRVETVTPLVVRLSTGETITPQTLVSLRVDDRVAMIAHGGFALGRRLMVVGRETLPTPTDGVWKPYTTTLYAGGNLAIGNGSLEARWTRTGDTVRATVLLVRGSTTNVGSGPYMFTLPTRPRVFRAVSGAGYVQGTDKYAPITAVGVSTTTVGLMYPSGGRLSHTNPGSWSTGDIIFIDISYEAA